MDTSITLLTLALAPAYTRLFYTDYKVLWTVLLLFLFFQNSLFVLQFGPIDVHKLKKSYIKKNIKKIIYIGIKVSNKTELIKTHLYLLFQMTVSLL